MITKQAVEEQLKRIGFNFRLWGRSEVSELGRILMDDEVIAQCVNGQYSNGFAMLVATNHRVLLVDKKPLLYLTVEDLRFDMITEFNYNHRLLDATIRIYTTNKTLVFTSWNQVRLRKLLEYTQEHVLQMRQQQHMAQQFQAAAAAQYAQAYAAHMGQPQFAQPPVAPIIEPPQPRQQIEAQAEVRETIAANEPQKLPETTEDSTIGDSVAAAATGLSRSIAHKRATLGTYTRSKLPSLHRRVTDDKPNKLADTGEGYAGYNLPLEYES